MWAVISGVIQIIYLFLKNKMEKDAEVRKKKEALYDEAKTAIKSRSISDINHVIGKLHK